MGVNNEILCTISLRASNDVWLVCTVNQRELSVVHVCRSTLVRTGENVEYWVSVNGSYLILSKVRTKRFVNILILHRG